MQNLEQNNQLQNQNEYSEEELSRFEDTSSYLGLAAVLISIYNRKANANTSNNNGQGSPIPEEDLRLISIVLVGIAVVIEFFVSKENLVNILKENGKRHPYHTSAAKNQLAARVFSALAITFLLIAEFQTREAEELIETVGPVPTLSGTIG